MTDSVLISLTFFLPSFIAFCHSPTTFALSPLLYLLQGLSIYRFANRIPLLFEGGNDVVAQVATKKIKWGGYKIKPTDKVGVFVSIVSTKIPFKGTSKEYIGDDKGIMHKYVTT